MGTFEERGRVFLGLVLRDTFVVDIAQANAGIEGTRAVIPSEMKELIVRYQDLRPRLYAIANAAARASGANMREVKALKILPPVAPGLILNAAVNYAEHANEMRLSGTGTSGSGAASKDRENINEGLRWLWERKPGDTRQNPYLFLKAPSAVIASGEAIRIPPRTPAGGLGMRIGCGQPANHVSVERAADYIFGWTLQNDVSDRQFRADNRHGSDWFICKSHDTFAPIGPFIVPKEFARNPMKLSQKFILSRKLMQDSSADRTTHNVYEMVGFASNVITLKPGDIVSMGSPAGVGAGRARPLYMKGGDVCVCTIEDVGTLTNPVVGP